VAQLDRRDLLRLVAGSFASTSLSGWFPLLADQASLQPDRGRSCILLWMPGGPSQLDTFDPKPDHENGGEFQAIDTSVPGMQFCEHLPQLARQAQQLAVIRSMKTKEGDHARAAYHLRTGYRPAGPIQYPTLGSLVSHEFPPNPSSLPNYVSILPNTLLNPAAYNPGFLGPRYAPLSVGSDDRRAQGGEILKFGEPLEVRNIRLAPGIDSSRADARMALLDYVDNRFANQRPGLPNDSHRSAYQQAALMMRSSAIRAFDLDEEPDSLRELYGKNRFGQGCLLARRLIEQGVPFVEVALSSQDGNSAGIGWDTHQEVFKSVKSLCGVLDSAWATLLRDLSDRGLLETTTVLWMGEFGRTPGINNMGGRDHFPNAWTTVLAGGGIRGGQVYGATSDSGMEVAVNPVAVNQLLATLLSALKIDYTKQNTSSVGRPIRLVEPEVTAIESLLS
jgi:hypothetical protein